VSADGVLDLLEELGAIPGVRGAVLATVTGAYAEGRHSTLDPLVANDAAKTVRRMVVASATVGTPLAKLVINFGAARILIVPVHEDATLAILLERDTATEAVRSLLDVERGRLRTLLEGGGASTVGQAIPRRPEGEDEVDRLLSGELGPVLADIEGCFARFAARTGVGGGEAHRMMRDQLREWLGCCNPSAYTFPLLLDGLSQTLNAAPDVRVDFMSAVQEIMRNSQVWAGRAGS
jgi:predicted regulator of Ras-like GTPase activity (Roadblock/LC7/MglB family)